MDGHARVFVEALRHRPTLVQYRHPELIVGGLFGEGSPGGFSCCFIALTSRDHVA
jgi:hypothetical protein